KDLWAPYAEAEIQRARERVTAFTSASPATLPPEDGPAPWRHVLRRADLLDLFDTSADLMGNDLDVSRFIRATEDKDAFLAWREWDSDGPPPAGFPDVTDDELCPVPIGELREFLRKRSAYVWNFATEQWTEVDKDKLCPGTILLTRAGEGGYTSKEGWYPESKAVVPPLSEAEAPEPDGDSSDRLTWRDYWQSLRDHTRRVCEELSPAQGHSSTGRSTSRPSHGRRQTRLGQDSRDFPKNNERRSAQPGLLGQTPGTREACPPSLPP